MVKKVLLKIIGMHCTSCAFNIDGKLEDTERVRQAKTSYAKQQTEVAFDPEKVSLDKIISTIRKLDEAYDAKMSNKK